MGYHCNNGLQSDNVLDCSSSFSSENLKKEEMGRDGSYSDGTNLDGSHLDGSHPDGLLWSDWEEIFLRLDQQDGVHDGRILSSSLSSWLETLSLQDTVKLEMMQGVGRAKVSNMVLNFVKFFLYNIIQRL